MAVLRPVRHSPDIHANAVVSGLRTFPFVAAVKANKVLGSKKDRAALILSNQIMVGGMGSVYTHDLRTMGVSYRPSGGVKLSWQGAPVLTLNATFDQIDKETGTKRTNDMLAKWQAGDEDTFSAHNIEAAGRSILEQVRLRSSDFPAIEYDLLARLDPNKLGSEEFIKQLEAVQNEEEGYLGGVLRSYFAKETAVGSIVHG
jgi:predicted Zn-dependent peptidase